MIETLLKLPVLVGTSISDALNEIEQRFAWRRLEPLYPACCAVLRERLRNALQDNSAELRGARGASEAEKQATAPYDAGRAGPVAGAGRKARKKAPQGSSASEEGHS